MKLSQQQFAANRLAILQSARRLFDSKGFENVSIDDVMSSVGLTRGGFYRYFKTKGELYAESVKNMVTEYASRREERAGRQHDSADIGAHIISAYLSPAHVKRNDSSCPMVVLPTDLARGAREVSMAFQLALEAMIGGLSQGPNGESLPRDNALVLAALCVGGMVLARSVDSDALAQELRTAALRVALQLRVAPASLA